MRAAFAVLLVTAGLVAGESLNMKLATADEVAPAAEQSLELKVLDRFVGKGESASISRPGKEEKPKRTTGVNTSKWVLGGQFLQDTGRESDNTEHIGTWTWDREQKVYRAWYFFSEGSTLELNADWSE